VGVVVFLRTSPSEMAVLHVAVHPDYALQGRQAGVGLGVTLVEKVKEIASRIVGVEKIVFFYRQHVVIRI
jgi:ribosomal protein S18 acetylase RimI-like enzyme